MKTHILFRLLLFIAAFISLGRALAQGPELGHGRGMDIREVGTIPPILFDAINLPSTESTKSRIEIIYRIPSSFFVLTRSDQFGMEADSSLDDGKQTLKGRGEVSVELLNPAGRSVARQSIQRTIHSRLTGLRVNAVEGAMTFHVAPDEYTIVLTVTDRESNREFIDKTRKVAAKKYQNEPLLLSDIVFLEAPLYPALRSESRTLVNLGRDVFFGKNFDIYFEAIGTGKQIDSTQIILSLVQVDRKGRDSVFIIRDSLMEATINNRMISAALSDTSATYSFADSDDPKRRALIVPIETKMLQVGSYLIRLTAQVGGLKQTLSRPIAVSWVSMPRSLMNFSMAVAASEYVATKQEWKMISEASSELLKNEFDKFWKRRDPTPETAFNEGMAEYYRRVDEANIRFGTLKVKIGWKTDRGKIFILYGEPTNVERKLPPGQAPAEIWTYEQIKKRFTFTDRDRNGLYKLLSTETL